jgi:peptidyl-Lys metalloendopeptidase
MRREKVSVYLEIASQATTIEATLLFTNNENENIFLYRINSCISGAIENDLFIITSSDGNLVPYTGILIKRTPLILEDFIELLPGETLTSRVTLNDTYEFFPARHLYTAQYSAYNPSFERQGLFKMVSNEVNFEF